MTDLLTSDQVIEAIGITTDLDTRDTALVARIAAAIGPVIEDLVGPVLPATKTLTTNGGTVAVLLPNRPQSVTSVTEGGTATTDYFVDTDAAIIYGGTRSGVRTFASGELVIVYEAGMATITGIGSSAVVTGIPGHILYAAYEQCRIWWQQGQQSLHSGYGYDSEGPSPVPMGFAVSTRVRELLAPTKRLPGFA